MDRKLLMQYCDLQEEIKQLEKWIDKLDMQQDKMEHDVVTGSTKEFPYLQTNIYIEGSTKEYLQIRRIKLHRYHDLLRMGYDRLLDLQTQIEEYIMKIEDSKIRRIFRLRYIEKQSWPIIALQMGQTYTADGCRMLHNRYIEKN